MIAANASTRSAIPTAPTFTPSFTALETCARSRTASRSVLCTNGSIRARMRSTRRLPSPVATFARARLGLRDVNLINGTA